MIMISYHVVANTKQRIESQIDQSSGLFLGSGYHQSNADVKIKSDANANSPLLFHLV